MIFSRAALLSLLATASVGFTHAAPPQRNIAATMGAWLSSMKPNSTPNNAAANNNILRNTGSMDEAASVSSGRRTKTDSYLHQWLNDCVSEIQEVVARTVRRPPC